LSYLVILAVGKVKERGLRDAFDDYAKRIARHFPIEEVEVREPPNPCFSPRSKKNSHAPRTSSFSTSAVAP
jgi:23S rRNA pseudoU1915 N3-methylase RlmH